MWIAVCGIGAQLLSSRWDRVRYEYDIGHADSAAYAWQGRQLAAGKGWKIPYVTNFLYRYDPEITRRDDQWAPLLSFVLVPAFLLGEDNAATARMTTVWISTILLPLSVCLLVQALTLRAWPGLPAALPVWFSVGLFEQSTSILNDQLVTAVLCLFLAAVLASRKKPQLLWFCGLLMALAWYGKGSQVMLFPFLAGAVLLLHGPKGVLSRPFWGSLLIAGLLMFPRLWENSRDHGNPLHSTQPAVSSYFGLGGGWDPGFYSIYWGRDLPGLKNRFAYPAMHARSMARNTEIFFRSLLLGIGAEKKDWQEMGEGPAHIADELRRGRKAPKEILAEVKGSEVNIPRRAGWKLAGMLAGLLGLLTAAGGWLLAICHKREFPLTQTWGAAAVVFVFVLMQSVFMIVCWGGSERLFYPALIPASILAWSLLPPWPRRFAFPDWAPVLLTGLFVVAVWVQVQEKLPGLKQAQRAAFRHPPATSPHYPKVQRLAAPLAEQLPADAVLMARNPWEILWYAPAGMKAVGLPYAPPEDLLAVAHYYRVTHLVLDRDRPGLKNYIKKHPEIFQQVITSPWPVYEIHWDRLNTDSLTPLAALKPLWDPRKAFEDPETRLKKKWGLED